jgi:serine O-acetyltransferase
VNPDPRRPSPHDEPRESLNPSADAALARAVAARFASRHAFIPLQQDVASWTAALLGALFPEHASAREVSPALVQDALAHQRALLTELLRPQHGAEAAPLALRHSQSLPAIFEDLLLDAEAILSGDPAATTLGEVIATYPGFRAIAIHRLAHALLKLGVPVIPRMMSEQAHAQTGIDIHPGASIGPGLCIDHGTGIVVGETAHIGKGVKMYQGVTLGALSVRRDLANTKRHPTIEDAVTLYAGATVLGGATVIGAGSIIGANVSVTSSVPPRSIVHQRAEQQFAQRPERKDTPTP